MDLTSNLENRDNTATVSSDEVPQSAEVIECVTLNNSTIEDELMFGQGSEDSYSIASNDTVVIRRKMDGMTCNDEPVVHVGQEEMQSASGAEGQERNHIRISIQPSQQQHHPIHQPSFDHNNPSTSNDSHFQPHSPHPQHSFSQPQAQYHPLPGYFIHPQSHPYNPNFSFQYPVHINPIPFPTYNPQPHTSWNLPQGGEHFTAGGPSLGRTSGEQATHSRQSTSLGGHGRPSVVIPPAPPLHNMYPQSPPFFSTPLFPHPTITPIQHAAPQQQQHIYTPGGPVLDGVNLGHPTVFPAAAAAGAEQDHNYNRTPLDCSGCEMYNFLLDCIRVLHSEVTQSEFKDNLRTCLLPLEKIFQTVSKQHMQFTSTNLRNEHSRHHPFFCNFKKAEVERQARVVGEQGQQGGN